MNITYVIGDATEPVGEGPKFIVHICNDVGLWGAGFVKAISRKWNQPEKIYRLFAERNPERYMTLGNTQYVSVGADITVVNLIGQHGVRSASNPMPVDYAAVRKGLNTVRLHATFSKSLLKAPVSVHMPRIGCGLGGGSWDKMEPIIRDTLCVYGVPVTVYDLA